ncbi:membrane protein insertion efficiency factor YidD [Candidatus Odyssella thessalonicensis]|uniref:membrane protein insertion efficiency factor YidD n=1 Tax=Candidatus Odyssella thessalonicensis TaxID=84647 RepID=UPI000225ABF2|nr:membrane protein insertion efficiency factor YidD [Candidatus Odyssella thessalonicensis]
MIVKVLIFFVHSYRWLISPYLQPRCRFQPTCSAYAVHALQHHGLKRGLYFIMRRLMRCHPFKSLGGSYGYDPVPHPQSSTFGERS